MSVGSAASAVSVLVLLSWCEVFHIRHAFKFLGKSPQSILGGCSCSPEPARIAKLGMLNGRGIVCATYTRKPTLEGKCRPRKESF